jgi:hypothetical protein
MFWHAAGFGGGRRGQARLRSDHGEPASGFAIRSALDLSGRVPRRSEGPPPGYVVEDDAPVYYDPLPPPPVYYRPYYRPYWRWHRRW